MKNSFIFLRKISWLLLCRLSEVPWPPSDWLQMLCLINFQAKSLAWLNTTLFRAGHAVLVKAVEKAAVPLHVLFLEMQNLTEPFLGAQDLVPRLYLVFCLWCGLGQISWCLRWDLQRWTLAPRYHSQYFYFHFSLTFLCSWYLICAWSFPVLGRAVLNHFMLPGLWFHPLLLMTPKLLITCLLTF